MSFLQPWLLALAALAIIVVLLHIQRRRSRTVPSLVVWRRVQASAGSRNWTPHWPRPSLLLLLQVLAVALAALALAQPILGGGAREHWIVVVDPAVRGADAEARLSDAIAEVRALAQRHEGEVAAFTVVKADADPDVVVAAQPYTAAALETALGEIWPGEQQADWDASGRLVEIAKTGRAEQPRVVLVSDTTPDAGLAVRLAGTPIDTVAVGASQTGAELTAAVTEITGVLTARGSIRFGDRPEETVVIGFTPDGAQSPLPWSRYVVRSRTDGSDAPFEIAVELPGPGVVSIGLDDVPAAGTFQYVVNPASGTADVLYVGPGGQRAVRALQAIPGVTVFRAETLPDDVSGFALVVLDRVAVDRAPETNTLWIGDARIGDSQLAAATSLVPDQWSDEHALSAGVSWSAVGPVPAAGIAPAPGSEIILSAAVTPLVTAATGPFGRDVRIAFDPSATAWSEQSGFPRFVYNVVGWAGVLPASGRVARSCVVGTACVVDARLIGGTAVNGDDTIALDASGRFIPARAGIYALANGAGSTRVAVNPARPSMAAGAVAAASPERAGSIVVWPWIAAAALFVLLVEMMLAGRGPERYLTRLGLSGANPLASRRRAMLGLRSLTLALIVLALLNLPLSLPFGQDRVVVIGDDVVALAGRGDTVVLGRDDSGLPLRIGETLKYAAGLAPDDRETRIVLSGVPAATVDEVAGAAAALTGGTLTVDIVPAAGDGDIAVTDVATSQPVFAGDTVILTATVASDTARNATLSILRDGAVIDQQEVALASGNTRIETVIDDVAAEPALYEVVLADAGDPVPLNDRNGLWLAPREAGRIAVVGEDAFQAAFFARLLRTQGLTVVSMKPDKSPATLDAWLEFDGFVLLNLPAIALATRQQLQIEAAVREHGRGLVILGGANSFGPGGYLETALERLSPLSSNIPREAPEVAMLFVLDRSGSMQQKVGGVTRLDIAKRATEVAVSLLNPKSQVSVIVFDELQTVALPMQAIGDGVAVNAAIRGIDAGGGTAIYPGLVEATRQLQGNQSRIKHVVVMTDGLSQPGDFKGIVSTLREQGATVSTVAIGQGAGAPLVSNIAELGGGTFHATQDFEALPSILSQEALLLSESAVEEGETTPVWTNRSARFTRDLPDELPAIGGFVLTTAKPQATVEIATANSEGKLMPLLASWRYGNGQVAALATEGVGAWTADWQRLESYPLLWSQIVRQFLPPTEGTGFRIAATRNGDTITVTVDRDLDGDEPASGLPSVIIAALATPDAGTPLTLRSGNAEGRFVATWQPPAAGDYLVSATDGDESASARVHIAYAHDLDPTASDAGLTLLAEATGGTVYGPGEAPVIDGSLRFIRMAGWPIFLGGALLLFFAELLLRYSGTAQRLFSRPVRISSPAPARNASAPQDRTHEPA